MISNRTAIILGAVLLLAALLDVIFTGGNTLLFLARRFIDLISFLAFWR